ncbi:hypothetical protein [Cytobacillus purgationiresistens]|uniref:Lipopolysaccharide export LptBFGC system permease protein LptF n=1 Tax=Cytobacillus purgationiresistens TaxID=863449 RepID=A0ABU0ANA9_9BACI|nr:hypothetical protein [Cytobacillus purgationiresistens]MDQ0272772.1 lipopolysaccharide export LptBFGC system permease protein LptF [Cytobacillus purgationiresistens]
MYRKRNKFTPLILILGAFLGIFILVSVFKNTNVYVVYRVGLGTIFITGITFLAIVILFLKGR